jgi:hypothetical protein
MGRPRTANVMLPPNVQRVIKPSGRIYYYYAPGRGTEAAGKRIPLGGDAPATRNSGDCYAKHNRPLLVATAHCLS